MGKIQNNASKELVLNTIIFGMSTLGSKVIMFLLLPVYTHFMSANQLGEAELVVNCMNLLYPMTTINILSALLRFAMDSNNDKKKVLQNTIIVVVVGIIITGCILFLLDIQSAIGKWKIYLILLLFFYAMEQILAVFAKALDKIRISAFGSILYTLITFFASLILLIFFKRNTAGYLEGMIIANIITFIYFVWALNIKQFLIFEKVDIFLLKEMVFFSLPLIINSVSWWIASFCDRFLLEFYLDTGAVGLYSIASKIPTIVSTFSSIFIQAWVLSAIKEFQNKKFFEKVFRKYSAIFILWTSIIIMLFKWFLPFLVSGDFFECWRYIPFLLCAAMFSGIGSFFSAIYTSAKKNVSVMITTLCGATVNIIFNVIFIPLIGIQGAVVATMISQLVIMVFRMIGSRQFIEFDIDYIKLIVSGILLILESYILLYTNHSISAVIICLGLFVLYGGENVRILVFMYKSAREVFKK